MAEWERVRISSSEAKMTLCSPTMPPARTTEKPISPAGRAPVPRRTGLRQGRRGGAGGEVDDHLRRGERRVLADQLGRVDAWTVEAGGEREPGIGLHRGGDRPAHPSQAAGDGDLQQLSQKGL